MTMIKRSIKPQFLAQRGYAMLGIIAAVGVAATAMVVTSLSATAVRNEQGRKNSSALALAKQALIASAASSPTRPGSLPCPDIDNDGQSDPVSGACTASIGRLPWQTLGLPDLRDAAGERLWYAVSDNFQDVPANHINSSVSGQLQMRSGASGTLGVVAIVFAPGQAIGSQQRDPLHVNSAESYLESYDSANKSATLRAPDGAFNDQLASITPADIFSLVERRVAKEIQNALQTYYGAPLTAGRLPWPAQTSIDLGNGAYSFPMMSAPSPLPSPATMLQGFIPTDDSHLVVPGWFDTNNWRNVMHYYVDSNCAAGQSPCGSAVDGFSSGNNFGVLIGDADGVLNAGTKAVLSFLGVNHSYNNYQTTVIGAAVQ